MGRPYFGRPSTYPAPPIAHALHDDNINADVIDGDLAEVVHDGLPVKPPTEPEPESALSLGCR